MNTIHKRHLPHLYFDEGKYFITYRLANSLPQNLIKQIKHPEHNWDFVEYTRALKRYDSLLAAGNYGINYLSEPAVTEICKETIHYPDNKEYKLICYTIMSNHVHLVIELLPGNKGISKIMQSIKGISAIHANRILKRTGAFWQDESFDRWIRNDKELYFIIKYILMNPVEAGFVSNWKDYPNTYCKSDYCCVE